jgi:hypothetical protein
MVLSVMMDSSVPLLTGVVPEYVLPVCPGIVWQQGINVIWACVMRV